MVSKYDWIEDLFEGFFSVIQTFCTFPTEILKIDFSRMIYFIDYFFEKEWK